MSFQNPVANDTDFNLIETMRQENGELIRLKYHLARLRKSAKEFGFLYREKKVRELLLSEHNYPKDNFLRVRLELYKNGHITVQKEPFTPVSDDIKWRLRIAKTRSLSSDKMRQHKTSRREIFDTARNEFTPQTADEVILLNEHDELCEGVRTNIFIRYSKNRILLTPKQSCGLLPGTFRAEMLEKNYAIESIIPLKELLKAESIFVGNSLYDLRPAFLDTVKKTL